MGSVRNSKGKRDIAQCGVTNKEYKRRPIERVKVTHLMKRSKGSRAPSNAGSGEGRENKKHSRGRNKERL